MTMPVSCTVSYHIELLIPDFENHGRPITTMHPAQS